MLAPNERYERELTERETTHVNVYQDPNTGDWCADFGYLDHEDTFRCTQTVTLGREMSVSEVRDVFHFADDVEIARVDW